jgi:hypothetical protein
MNADVSRVVVYSGTSMHPTLREPDVLEIESCRDRPVRPGDIVFFRAPGRAAPVVHRVERVSAEGILTRVDNCRRPDEWILSAGDIVGRVIAARRGDRRRRIANGTAGRVRAGALRLWLPIRAAARRVLRIPYRAITDSGAFARLLPAAWRPRKALFQAGERRVWRILWGRRVIGEYQEGSGRWRIRPPFRLLVDPRELEKRP